MTTATTFRHYSATIKLPDSGYFPLFGEITERNMLMLANNGTTPGKRRAAELQDEAARIRQELEAGRTVETRSAIVSPISAEEYTRCR